MIKKLFKKVYDKLSGKTQYKKPSPEQAVTKLPESHKPDDQPEQKRQAQQRSKPVAGKKWCISSFHVPPEEGKTRFHDMDLPLPLMHAISDLGFKYCTPIQAEILPSTLAGKDASGRAQTGTGKTAAFLITVITKLHTKPIKGKRRSGVPRVLILAPTRELVLQIAKEAMELTKFCHLKIVTVFGGMDYKKQKRQLSEGIVDIAVATPGRLLDFLRHKDINLRKVETLIIDEADRMLDMGFIPDVRKIIYSTPKKENRQTLLFSATLTPEITRMSASWTCDPVSIEIEPEQIAVNTVDQVVYIVTNDEKFALLYNVITRKKLTRVIIFCNRRDETRDLEKKLSRYGMNCALLSGEIPQNKRIKTLDNFKAGKIQVMVATDVAGRGIHVEGMDHVINYMLPHDPEDYVHRIGRTGRAGTAGTSISFACEDDSFYIPAIEEFIGRKLDCIQPDEDWLIAPPPPPRKKRSPQEKSQKKKFYSKKYQGGNKKPGNRRPTKNRPAPRRSSAA